MIAQTQQPALTYEEGQPGRGGAPLPVQIARHRMRLFFLFLLVESLVFIIIPASAHVEIAALIAGQAAITVALLLVALWARRTTVARAMWPVFFAFFVGALSLLVSLVLGDSVQAVLGYSTRTASGVALAKLAQSLLRILPLLLLVGLTRKGRQSLFLKRGRLGLSLAVGAAAFAVFVALAYGPLAGNTAALRRVASWTPWVLLFIFANAFEEELLFRGLFLKRYEPFLGKGLSLLATAIVFTLLHLQVTYVSDLIQFVLILFPLGLAFGYLMQKSDSIWGSVLFHAGADLLIIVPWFASL